MSLKKLRVAIVLGAVVAGAAMPAVASAHVVRISANDKVVALHSGPFGPPPAHTGGLLTASEAVDGTRDGQLNVGP